MKKKRELINNIRESVLNQLRGLDKEKVGLVRYENSVKKLSYLVLENIENDIENIKDKSDIDIIIDDLSLILKRFNNLMELTKDEIEQANVKIIKNKGTTFSIINLANYLMEKGIKEQIIKLEFEKIERQIKEIILDYLSLSEEINEIHKLIVSYIPIILEINNSFLDEKEDIKLDEVFNNKKYKKIFDYREMNNLMIERGFNPVRQTGSHLIYSNNNISIPVPQHTIGKGLSIAIQKQLLKAS
ncbi:MAG: type II toxin-antitoxin system HicA family toxin [Sarcina sp.]